MMHTLLGCQLKACVVIRQMSILTAPDILLSTVKETYLCLCGALMENVLGSELPVNALPWSNFCLIMLHLPFSYARDCKCIPCFAVVWYVHALKCKGVFCGVLRFCCIPIICSMYGHCLSSVLLICSEVDWKSIVGDLWRSRSLNSFFTIIKSVYQQSRACCCTNSEGRLLLTN